MTLRTIIVAALALLTSIAASNAEQPKDTTWDHLNGAIERFQVTIPLHPAARESVRRALEELTRERCDSDAIKALATALQTAAQKREAANAYVHFSKSCNGHPESLRLATNIYLVIADFEEAAATATEFIALQPLNDNAYFLRAVAYDRGNEPKKAIDDYTSAIELFQPKAKIADIGYVGLAKSYDKVGRPCDAALAIESWVALNPILNDTARARAVISGYEKKGACIDPVSGTEDVFPIQRLEGGVIIIPVTVNGIKARFMVDTGASTIGMKQSFAEKAKVPYNPKEIIKMGTANGMTDCMLGRIQHIQLKSIQAKDIAVVVQPDAKLTIGNTVDGLLGMNLLARFNVTIDSKSLRIKRRAGR